MRVSSSSACASAVLLLALSSMSCAREAPPLPQLVVVVDTDAVVVSQLVGRDDLSPAAAIDSVLVDVLDERGRAIDAREIVAADARDWPLSFGVASGGARSSVRLRIRAFRAATAHAEGDSAGGSLLVPQPTIAIDRVVDLQMPSEGKVTARVLLSFACFGVQPTFLAPATTCIDESRKHAPPSTGITTEGDASPSRVGTTKLAYAKPCTATREGAVCVPGGFTILGDVLGITLVDDNLIDATPPRPTRVEPFLMDRTEFTVGRYRAMLRAGLVADPRPIRIPEPRERCTWISVLDGKNDLLPLNCIDAPIASAACAASSGSLPTEAQWEHAARGRGRGWSYAWGDVPPRCCTTSISRDPFGFNICTPIGLEPVSSHPPSDACGGFGDRSIDGVDDLGGSLNELTLDKGRRYSDPCWRIDGIAFDPTCVDPLATAFIARGNDWATGAALSVATYRRIYTVSPNAGFRCVYPGAAP